MNHTHCFLPKLSAVLFGCYAVTASAAPSPVSRDYVNSYVSSYVNSYVNSTMIGQEALGGVVFFTY